MKKPKFNLAGYVRCPECGQALMIPDPESDHYICANNKYNFGNIPCSNNKKYRLPTIELEELNEKETT